METVLKANEAANLFELAPDEIEICLNVRGAAGRYELRHKLRPPTLDDWREYERALRSTVQASGSDPDALSFESSPLEAAAAIYDRLFRSAAGYRLAEGANGLTAAQIPVHHKEMVVRAISEVTPVNEGQCSEMDEAAECKLFALDADHIEVMLEASRGGAPGEKRSQLTHVFRVPLAVDRVEYSRVISQALYVRGSQSVKTILPSRLPGLAAIYDRLIEQVRGYSVHGAPLADRAAIVKAMDPLHKKVAVQILFGE